MLKLESGRPQTSNDDNLIPLINVVFLMLIFFMVAGQISKSDAIKIDPPFSANENKGGDIEPVTLLVPAAGDIYLQDEAVAREQITERLNQLFALAEDPEQFSVLVKVDANLPVEELQTVLRQIKAAGLLKVSLATRLEGGAPPDTGVVGSAQSSDNEVRS